MAFLKKNYHILLFQVENLNSYLMKVAQKNKGRCQLAVSPKLIDYPSLAFQFGLPIGSPYAEIFSKYVNLTFLPTVCVC